MRWSFWPVSITLHVIALFAMFIVPLTAEVSWPVPAPIHRLALATKVVPVPPDVVSTLPARPVPRNVPSVVAPTTLAPPPDVAPPPFDFSVADRLAVGDGTVDPGVFGPTAVAGPRIPAPPAPDPKPAAQILRVGQGIREPKRIGGAPPEYPDFARRSKVEGVVILEAVINERGAIERVKVLKSEPLLNAAAIAAVKEWRYTPTLLNGTPVSVLMTITINFTLHD